MELKVKKLFKKILLTIIKCSHILSLPSYLSNGMHCYLGAYFPTTYKAQHKVTIEQENCRQTPHKKELGFLKKYSQKSEKATTFLGIFLLRERNGAWIATTYLELHYSFTSSYINSVLLCCPQCTFAGMGLGPG